MKKIFKRSVWTLLTIFFALILIIAVVAGLIARQYSSWIDTYFGVTRYQLVDTENAEKRDTQYYKSDYAVKDENGNLVLTKDENGIAHQTFDQDAMRAHSIEIAEKVGEEGSVLLWNKNNALPLASGTKVTLLGVNFLDWLFVGGGSGHIDVVPDVSLRDTFEERGMVVNSDAWMANIYAKSGSPRKNDWNFALGGSFLNNVSICESSWTKLNETRKGNLSNSIAEYNTAIYSISRSGAEDGDTNFKAAEVTNGDYLDLSEEEKSILAGLQDLKQQGKLSKIILIINTACSLSLRTILSYEIDACLWVGMGGNASYGYMADLLMGNANPSGRLTDTWVKDVKSAPSYQNFGDYDFTESAGVPSDEQHAHNTKYVVYQEGIYVGYRYYETRYEDYVLGRGGASSANGSTTGSAWKYSDEVVSPFGSGESYTTFSYGKISVRRDGKDYIVSVPVTNTGSVAGKEVVQIYLQKPYTQYDKDNKVEKAAVELVGFDKTALLDPGKSETVQIIVPEYEFKSYDSYGKKTYILEAGDYFLTAGKNAHDAANNILAAKGLSAEQKARMDGEGNADLVYKAGYSEDIDDYAVSPYTGVSITNEFENADINSYEGTKDQKIIYLTRNDWNGTYPAPVALKCTDTKMVADMQYGGTIEEDPDAAIPLYDTVTSEYGKLTLIQLKGIPFDDPLWDDLLNQLTWEETNLLISRGAGAIAGATSVAAPGFKSSDGPVGTNGMAFPCNPIVASTFNTELEEQMGKAFGMEVMQVGRTGIYAPGANIHRNPYGGRTFEYYSEDGFLSGKSNASVTRGLQSMGAVVFTKHFALNEQETNRYGTTTWANEQSIRELYLKSFELGVVEAEPRGIMTSFNRIGCTWSGNHKGLLADVLKGEWGFLGIAETDAVGAEAPYMNTVYVYAKGVVAGQDVWMDGGNESLFNDFRNNATVCLAMRKAAHRVLYNQLQSSAMNGVSSSTEVIYVTPAWEKMILALEIVSGIITGLCAAMVAASWVLWAKDRKKETNE